MRQDPFVQKDPLGLNLGAIASDYVLSVGGFLVAYGDGIYVLSSSHTEYVMRSSKSRRAFSVGKTFRLL